jgi:hypothetical protein
MARFAWVLVSVGWMVWIGCSGGPEPQRTTASPPPRSSPGATAPQSPAVTPSSTPSPYPFDGPPPSTAIRALAARGPETCALDAAGDVYCFGAEEEISEAQRGKGEALRRIARTPGAIGLAFLGTRYIGTICAFGPSGVGCWSAHDVSALVVPPGPGLASIRDVTALAEVGRYTCALHGEKKVYCVPTGDTAHSMTSRYFGARAFDIPAFAGADQLVGISDTDELCRRQGDKVACGQLVWDRAGKRESFTNIAPLPELDGAIDIAAVSHDGGSVVCARLAHGARCVKLTRAQAGALTATIAVDIATPVAALALGGKLCTLGSGAVGCRTLSALATETRVPLLADATSIAVGDAHACAVRRTGSVVCWGDNALGQLGVFDPELAEIAEVPGIDDASDLVIAAGHACALRASGTVTCWATETGSWTLGEPHALAGISDAVGIGQTPGWDNVPRTLALRKDGTIGWLWTIFDRGKVKYDEHVDPTAHLTDVVAMTNSAFGTMVTTRDGRVRSLTTADNAAKNPTHAPPETPLLVGPILRTKDHDAITAMRFGACSITKARRVLCFVDREHTGRWVETPVLRGVTDATDLVTVRATELAHHNGASDLCALRESGEVVCTTYGHLVPKDWATYKPFLAADLVALFDGPCARRKSGSFSCAWYAHPAWAAILRAAERIPDVARLRFDSDAAAACAIQTNRHVACVRATADGKPRHLLPSSATPVHVVWP